MSLLGYYFLDREPEARVRRTNHILWLIEHRPEVGFTGYSTILQREEPDAYSKAKQLWAQTLCEPRR